MLIKADFCKNSIGKRKLFMIFYEVIELYMIFKVYLQCLDFRFISIALIACVAAAVILCPVLMPNRYFSI